MTVDRVIHCVCTYPEVEDADWMSDEGMPHLVVRNGLTPHKQFWSAFCPKCGRGSALDSHKSAYLALKHWNEFQSHLWDIEKEGAGWILE